VRTLRRRISYLIALAAIGLSFAAPSVGAQDSGRVEIPVGTVVRTAPGVETLLGAAAVPADLVGTACGVTTRAENNQSIHPGNHLVVASGGDRVTLFDVEGSSGKITTASSRLTLGVDVTITLIMGVDGVFSGGASAFVVVDCAPATTTSTSTTSTSTTSTSTTTTSSTTSTSSTTTSTSTSTTVAPTTTPTVEPTIEINGPTTTIDGPATTSTTSPPPPEPPTLAVTGARETVVLAIAGILLLDLGYLIFSTRRPAAEPTRDE
jgi:hypothetical protein